MQRSADVRYQGQSYEITIPVGQSGHLTPADVARLIADFHLWHERIYAYGDPTEAVEVVNLRLAAIGPVPPLDLEREGPEAPPAPEAKGRRQVYFLAGGFAEAKVYERDNLVPGQTLPGPCLIEEATSTTVIPPGREATVDRYGNLTVGLEA